MTTMMSVVLIVGCHNDGPDDADDDDDDHHDDDDDDAQGPLLWHCSFSEPQMSKRCFADVRGETRKVANGCPGISHPLSGVSRCLYPLC